MHDNRILETLRTPNAILAVLVLALVAQTPHAADVFRLIVHGTGPAAILHSYSFAIALELAVLLFVVQRRHHESYGFAAVSIAMNISYYYLHDVQLWSLAALPAMLVSVALPAAIARYSHVVAEVQVVQPAQQPMRKPVAQSEPDAQTDDAQIPVADKRQQARQMHSEGLPIAQIARDLGVHRNTVSAWVRNGHHTEDV